MVVMGVSRICPRGGPVGVVIARWVGLMVVMGLSRIGRRRCRVVVVIGRWVGLMVVLNVCGMVVVVVIARWVGRLITCAKISRRVVDLSHCVDVSLFRC